MPRRQALRHPTGPELLERLEHLALERPAPVPPLLGPQAADRSRRLKRQVMSCRVMTQAVQGAGSCAPAAFPARSAVTPSALESVELSLTQPPPTLPSAPYRRS